MRMVEKVARRLWGQEHVLSLGTYSADDFAWHVTPERDKEKFRMMARAAIEAMREPDDEMAKAGIAAWEKSPMAVVTQFRAMIDKAIQESGE